ncbi:hypothetical protein IW262DRAFT_292905 [Armillaria fumosa]|nr:hypothetical protein IW262DRAFT_292905 [Armillaria fumosa]
MLVVWFIVMICYLKGARRRPAISGTSPTCTTSSITLLACRNIGWLFSRPIVVTRKRNVLQFLGFRFGAGASPVTPDFVTASSHRSPDFPTGKSFACFRHRRTRHGFVYYRCSRRNGSLETLIRYEFILYSLQLSRRSRNPSTARKVYSRCSSSGSPRHIVIVSPSRASIMRIEARRNHPSLAFLNGRVPSSLPSSRRHRYRHFGHSF